MSTCEENIVERLATWDNDFLVYYWERMPGDEFYEQVVAWQLKDPYLEEFTDEQRSRIFRKWATSEHAGAFLEFIHGGRLDIMEWWYYEGLAKKHTGNNSIPSNSASQKAIEV